LQLRKDIGTTRFAALRILMPIAQRAGVAFILTTPDLAPRCTATACMWDKTCHVAEARAPGTGPHRRRDLP